VFADRGFAGDEFEQILAALGALPWTAHSSAQLQPTATDDRVARLIEAVVTSTVTDERSPLL